MPPDPYDLVHLEFPNFHDTLTTGCVFVNGRTVDPIYRWRAEQIALCHGPPVRVVELTEAAPDVSPAPPVHPGAPTVPAGAGDIPLELTADHTAMLTALGAIAGALADIAPPSDDAPVIEPATDTLVPPPPEDTTEDEAPRRRKRASP